MKRLLLTLALLLGLVSTSFGAGEYYDHGSFPATGASLSSAAMRAELDLIEAGFNKLPTLTANGSKAVIVNSGGTALTVTTGTLTLPGNFSLSGSSAVTLTSTGTTTLTLPLTGTIATLAGTETFTNKTLTSPTINSATITGTLTWSPTITGHLLFTDATYDIGASGATRPRDLFLSRNAVFGGSLTLGTDLAITEGGTGLSAIGDDAVWVGDGATSATARTITNCTDTGGQHLNYTQSSNLFSCGTSVVTAPVFNRVVRTAGDVTTTSTSLVDLTGATITFTTGAYPIVAMFSGSSRNSATTSNTYFNVDIDGTLLLGTDGMKQNQESNAFDSWVSLAVQSAALTAASHTVKIQWKVDANTGTVLGNTGTNYVFSAHEIR